MPLLARSALYVPCDHERAVAGAFDRGADILIFDLEDGVAPERKAAGREKLAESLLPKKHTQCLLRINHRSTSYYVADIEAASQLPLDGIVLSKVSGTDDIEDAVDYLARHGRADLPIWCNVETPSGILNVNAIAAHASIAGLVAGTNDLANDLRIRRTPDRAGLMYALQRLVLAGRAYGRVVLDGTFIDLADEAGLKAEAEQGRVLGFDGKTLIHPKQIAAAHAVFGPTEADIKEAKEIISAYEQAMAEGKAVMLLGTRMIERLHYDRAQEVLALATD